MNLSAIAIKRPVFTVMVTIALMVLGVMGLARLGTDLFPDVTFPVVVVNVPYPGASPREVEQLVTKQIEDAVVSINGIDRLKSTSREGLSSVIILFKLNVDQKDAATQVRERVAQTRFKLPNEVKEPAVSRFDVGSTGVLTYTLSGAGKSLPEIAKFARDVIKPALEQVDGVASVEVKGGAEREVHVELDRAKIDALHLSPLSILEQLRSQNLNVPAGHYDEGVREISVRTVGELKDVDDIRNLIVATAADGSSVRLSDIGSIEDGFEELRTRIRVNGEAAVSFDVLKQSGTNTVAVSDAAKAKLAEISSSFPPGIKADIIIEQAMFIRENVHEVEIAIVFGGAMAILVILVFMLDLRSMIISSFALPTSVVATFFVMWLFGFSLNMMTLLALSLAIGLLIDDAVVVRENIAKHLERGLDPKTAALEGTKEIALAVLATTFTVVAVFVPVAFMTGIVGQFFRQFGLTIVAAVLVSLFVAFTLDPMLSSRFSKPHVHGAVDKFAWAKRPFEFVFKSMEDGYRVILGWSVRHKILVGILAFVSFVLMFPIAGLTGVDFVNQEDRGQFVVDVELPAGTKLAETSALSQPAEQKLLQDPRFVTLLSTLGPSGEVNKVKWRVVTVPKSERTAKLNELRDIARKTIQNQIPGARVVVTDPPFVEGAATEAPIMVQVRAGDYDTLAPLAKQFEEALKSVPGIIDVDQKYTPGQPELRVSVNREKAARAGVPVSAVALSLRAAIEGDEGGKLRQGKDEVPIRVRLGKSDRASMEDVLQMTMWTPKGPMALADLASVEHGEGPSAIEREDRERQIVIWAAPDGRSLGDLVPEMQAAFAKIKMPPGSSYHLDGQIRQMQDTNSAMGVAFLLALVFIYIVLASQFESFLHPVTIMLTTLPLAAVGAIVGVFLSGTTLAMGSFIGIIFLLGLVTKNAILVVDRALSRMRDNGETALQAILEAGPERLRPILMTSAAMVLGMLPTAISNGEGSEFRSPMAIAVIGGVVSSTVLSLVVVPAFFLTGEAMKAKFAKWFGRPAPQPVVVAAPPAAAE
ncbi:RND multidrug efflux transporter [Labilithrix luteola]|uniref:RND multidrug efflux transporter n=1 Tax=Labilithrix luteola TaxID=1391654 RepID=A0A0K1PUC9_9BACT|nr:efflux RND transporter permease subunit [Labilithrix luteola]AKU97148.1 RND multidrug efflux transporter [Labilithrix luteola]